MWNRFIKLYNVLYTMCKNVQYKTWTPMSIFTEQTSNYAIVVLNTPISLNFKKQTIYNLWTNATLRVTVDGGTDQWLTWLKLNQLEGCKNCEPDLITGDLDSITRDTLRHFASRAGKKKVISTPNQNETDFTKALKVMQQKLVEDEYLHINVVIVLADTSGRFDQIIANINTLFKAQDILPGIDVIMLASNSLTWLLGRNVMHKIDIPAAVRCNKEWCALIPIGNSCHVTSTGLKWNLANGILQFGHMVSTSNTYSGEQYVTVLTDNPIIWSMGIESLVQIE